MKNSLLLLAIAALVVLAEPTYGQYVYIDVNGDGLNSLNPAHNNPPGSIPEDILIPGTYSIDLWYVTNEFRDGTTATCQTGPEELTIGSYEAALIAGGSGTVVYNSWTDNMGFPTAIVSGGLFSDGNAAWLGYGGSLQPAGTYKVGSLNITVTGEPVMVFVPNNVPLDPNSQTAFGSSCAGSFEDYTLRYLLDFPDADGTAFTDDVVPTTWGKIKMLYR